MVGPKKSPVVPSILRCGYGFLRSTLMEVNYFEEMER